jgi:hypothetical protein
MKATGIPDRSFENGKAVREIDLNGNNLKVDDILESTSSHGIQMGNTVGCEKIQVNHIAEKTASHGITADNATSGFVTTPTLTKNIFRNVGTESGSRPMYSGEGASMGVRLAFSMLISGVSFWMQKGGSPTGNATLYRYSSSGKTSLATLDVSTLTGSYVEKAFTFTAVQFEAGDIIGLEYAAGNVSNYLLMEWMAISDVNVFAVAAYAATAMSNRSPGWTEPTTIVPQVKLTGSGL